MTDLFDQQITEGLRRVADDVGVPSGSFGDVRRRVRARRRRHIAAVSVPAVAGLAWVGLRPTVQPAPLSLGSPTAPTAPPSSTVATDSATAPTAPPSSTMPTSTSIGSVSTLPGSVSTLPLELLDDDPVAGAEALFVALGFPGDRYPTLEGGVARIVSADPERPDERRVVLTVRPGAPEVTPTTVSVGSDDQRVVVSAQAGDGRTYKLEIIDITGRNLPSPDEALELLAGIVP